MSDVKLAFGYRLTRGHKEWTSVSSSVKEYLVAYLSCTTHQDLLRIFGNADLEQA